VSFIRKYSVAWGGFSIVRATIALLNQAFNYSKKIDYFVLLSGQCLPIKSNKQIMKFLKENFKKSFIEVWPLPDDRFKNKGLDKFYYPVFFDQLGFIKKNIIKVFKKKIDYKKLLIKILRNFLKFLRIKRKIPQELHPCKGSQWWVLYRDVADYMLNYIRENPKILKYFKYTWAPDELFFQTLLYNSTHYKNIINQSLWYIDWSSNGPPKTLTIEDLPKIKSSGKLFARKFELSEYGKIVKKLRD